MRASPHWLAVAVAAAVLVAACREPTEVTVEITTDIPCERWKGTTLAIGQADDVERTLAAVVTSSCTPREGGAMIGTVVVVPRGPREASFVLRVIGGVSRQAESCAPAGVAPSYAGCIVARRAISFVPHTALHLPIVLRSACEGVSCDPRTTCVRGRCVSAELRPGDCSGPGCSEDALGGGGGTGKPQDGGSDARAPGDARADATPEPVDPACPNGCPAGRTCCVLEVDQTTGCGNIGTTCAP